VVGPAAQRPAVGAGADGDMLHDDVVRADVQLALDQRDAGRWARSARPGDEGLRMAQRLAAQVDDAAHLEDDGARPWRLERRAQRARAAGGQRGDLRCGRRARPSCPRPSRPTRTGAGAGAERGVGRGGVHGRSRAPAAPGRARHRPRRPCFTRPCTTRPANTQAPRGPRCVRSKRGRPAGPAPARRPRRPQGLHGALAAGVQVDQRHALLLRHAAHGLAQGARSSTCRPCGSCGA
jgi:hypothetical protein